MHARSRFSSLNRATKDWNCHKFFKASKNEQRDYKIEAVVGAGECLKAKTQDARNCLEIMTGSGIASKYRHHCDV